MTHIVSHDLSSSPRGDCQAVVNGGESKPNTGRKRSTWSDGSISCNRELESRRHVPYLVAAWLKRLRLTRLEIPAWYNAVNERV
jgi:hypothetical protein